MLLLTDGAVPRAQSPLEKAIDEIVKGDMPEEPRQPKKDEPKQGTEVDPPSKTDPGYSKLDGDILYRKRADGVEEWVRPDGTRQYRKGKKVVTINKDGDASYQESPAADVQTLPHRYRLPNAAPPRRPLCPTFRIREPQDDRKHADWREFERFRQTLKDGQLPWTPSGSAPPSPPAGVDPAEKIKAITELPDGKRLVMRENGVVQTQFPNNMTITTYPNSPQIAITDGKGNTTFATPEAGKILQYKMDGSIVTVDPQTGVTSIKAPNGSKEQVDRNGNWIGSDGKGGLEARGPGGTLSQFTDPDSKYKMVQDCANNVWVFDQQGNLVGKGVVGKDGQPDVRDILTNAPLPVGSFLNPPATTPLTAGQHHPPRPRAGAADRRRAAACRTVPRKWPRPCSRARRPT